VDETVVGAGFRRELAGGDLRVAALDEQAFRCVEERLLGIMPRVGDSQPFALR
jgi:hypothetical protein